MFLRLVWHIWSKYSKNINIFSIPMFGNRELFCNVQINVSTLRG